MIKLTKLNGKTFVVNAWHIEQLEAAPDTIITLANGKKFAVRETVEEVSERAKRFFADTSLRTTVVFGQGEDEYEG